MYDKLMTIIVKKGYHYCRTDKDETMARMRVYGTPRRVA